MIHSSAIVEISDLPASTNVWAFAHIMAGAHVGHHCNICDHVFIEAGAIVGNGVTIKNNALIWKGVTIADYCFIGPGVAFTNDRTPRSPRMPRIRDLKRDESDWLQKTIVDEGASIGANATICPGITLGAYCMIAAGSVVTRDVPAYALVAGNPARYVYSVNEYGERV